MKFKKLLSLMLCVVMLAATAFTTGCQKEEKEEEVKTGTPTLNMFVITEDETTDEQAKAVQLAINELTLKKIKAMVKINFIKEADYWTTIENTLLAIEELEAAKEAEKDGKKDEEAAEGEEAVEGEETEGEASEEAVEGEEAAEGEESEEAAEDEETEEDAEAEEEDVEKKELTIDDYLDMIIANGDVIIEEPQIDIIVFNSYDKYREYANNGKLAPLDEYLNLNSKILKSYIYPTYLEAAKLGGKSTFGIPVNGPIGSYEYFVFDKELADKYGFDVTTVKEFADLEGYLETIKLGEVGTGVVPLNRATSPASFEFYAGEGSPMGVYWTGTEERWPDDVLSTYDDPGVLEHYRTINRFRQAGYLADENTPAGTRFAVQILEGTIESPEKWEERDGREYECVVYKTPKLTNANALPGVFAISSKSYNREKSMELIKEFQTDKDLINTLQWGIENVHYYMNDENDGNGTITVINDCGYAMNTNYTGNRYLKYREVGEPWEFEAQKLQNLDSRVGGLAGFNPILEEVDELVLQNANAVAAKYYPDLIAGNGNFDEVIAALMAELNDVYSVGTFDKFISHKIGGSFNLYADAMDLAYPNGGNPVEEEIAEGDEAVEGEVVEGEAEVETEEAPATDVAAE